MFGQEGRSPLKSTSVTTAGLCTWGSRAAVRGPEAFNSEFEKDPEYRHSDSYTSDPDKRLTVDYVVELICESSVSIMGGDYTIRHVCMNTI